MYKYIGLGVLVLFMGCRKVEEKGSIAGKVTNGGVGQKGAIVLAITGDSLKNGDNINYKEVKGTLITSDAGDYKILLVDEGTYVVVAVKDKNNNLKFDDTVDMIGYYGHKDTTTGLTIPEKVSVSKGENKTEIDIDTLYMLPRTK